MQLVIAADALIRNQGGRLVLHSSRSTKPPLYLDSPNLLAWIAQFMKPTELALALGPLPSADRRIAQGVVDELLASNVLIPAGEQVEDSVELAQQKSSQHLKAMARQIYDLTADVQGLGEFAEVALRTRGALGLEPRLLALSASIDALRRELAQLREPYLTQQVHALGIDADASNLQLHLGCGPVELPGFINIDIAKAPLAMNVLWGLPFDDATVRVVYLSHLLEHLFYPRDVMFLLAEIHRVLMPGGLVRVVVPDIERCLRAYAEADQNFFAQRRENFAWWPEDATPLENFLTYAGVGPEPSAIFEAHKYGYDFETLARALNRAGFGDIRRSAFQQSQLPELRIEHLSEAARWRAGEEYLSLFVEATKEK